MRDKVPFPKYCHIQKLNVSIETKGMEVKEMYSKLLDDKIAAFKSQQKRMTRVLAKAVCS